MKIAVLADPIDNQSAGIHQYTDALVRHWLQLYPQHEFILIKLRTTDDYAAARQEVITLSNHFPWSVAYRLWVRIPSALRRLGVNVVVEPAHFGPFRLPPSMKRVTVIHDLTPLLFPQYHPWRGRWPQQWLLPRIIRNADLLITNSLYTESDLHRHFPGTKDKTVAAPLGVSASLKPTFSHTILEKYGIHAPYFLYLGTIEPRKNLNLLLNAYALFRDAYPTTVELVIAGKMGWKTAAFSAALQKHPYRQDIVLTGFVEEADKAVLYSSTWAFVYPSFYEGFGLPLLEAMACGAPCITTYVSSLPEVGGNAVKYIQPHDTSALSLLLMDFAKQPSLRQALATQAQQRARAFRWEQTAQISMQAIEALV